MAANKLITAYNDAGFSITATATPDATVHVKQGKYVPVTTTPYVITQNNNRVLTQDNKQLIMQGI